MSLFHTSTEPDTLPIAKCIVLEWLFTTNESVETGTGFTVTTYKKPENVKTRKTGSVRLMEKALTFNWPDKYKRDRKTGRIKTFKSTRIYGQKMEYESNFNYRSQERITIKSRMVPVTIKYQLRNHKKLHQISSQSQCQRKYNTEKK